MDVIRFKSFALSFLFLAVSFVAFNQNATIKGKVTDVDGAPLFNATIILEGQGKGATTDDKGMYEIKNVNPGTYTLIFRFTGLVSKSESITLAASQILIKDATLLKDIKDLEEVVVIGYGTTRTKDLTGSATVINEKNFSQGSLSTPEQLIMGKVSGLKITTNDGAPGSGSTLRLRGGTSLNASNDPLIVVDGVPLDNGGIAGVANPLSLINPNDIASFVVLKDASATAIYGSRAANGVILITTKKGDGLNLDKLKVVFDTKHSMSTIAKYADVLNGDELRRLVSENGTPAQSALLGTANTDWQKEVFRTAYVTDNNVSLTGGIKNLPYRLSIGNRFENGLLKDDRFIRTSASLNMNPTFFKKSLQVEFNQKLIQTNSVFANRGALGAAYFDPTQPVMSGSEALGGYYEWIENSGAPNTLAPKNPLGLIKQRDDRSKVARYIGNLKLTYKLPFFPMVKAVVNVGTDQSEGTGEVSTQASSASGYFTGGSFNTYRSTKGNKLIEAYANFNTAEKKSKHLIDLTAGYSYQDWFSSSPNLPVYNQAGDSIISPAAANPFYTKNALLSFYARGIYTFNDRYVINASLRRDGSSRFSPEARWGLFPAVSAAWIVTGEKFMQKAAWVSLLKVRAGFGITGQQDGIGDYAYISNYYEGATTAQYAFGGQYYTQLRPGGFDANLKWETTKSYNIGLDFGILKDRFSGSIDLYRKETSDLLATTTVPAGSNFTNEILTNVGSMLNQGIEMSLNAGLFATKTMRLDLTANASHNVNRVTKLTQVEDPNSVGILVGGISGGIGNTIQVQRVGYATYSFLVYEQQYDTDGSLIEVGQQASIDVNNDGSITSADKWQDKHAFVDRNGDGTINIEDRYIYDKVAPNWFTGLALNFSYKKWFAGVSMRTELGGHIYNNIHSNSATFQSINGTQGFISNISSLYYEDEVRNITTNQLLSDHYMEKANFLRMDYFNLGYNFGKLKALGNKVGLNATLVVNNVFVLSKYKGLDPEVGGGIDNNIYPRPRVYSLNLTFDF
ncbi:MAG: SusC/RagA family TonB-linked outer membrane protein [Flavobacteriales bacterium]|nr:SusC/RagA family TonB-linked outer membrane protein [Flavobacteriales bacterium]